MKFQDSIERFHRAACDARGLEDFGEDDYSEGLEVLCRSLDEDAKLSEIGEFAVSEMIVDALVARLVFEEGWKRHPEAAESRIERPLFIVGLPRTGTTALQHLLAQDPARQGFEHWLQRTPKPRPPRDEWESDADYLAAAERIRMIYERSPDMRAIHEIEAHLPDECWNVFSQNFAHSSWQANTDAHQYAAWWADFDMTPAYERHRRNAQLIGHRDPERGWLFKDATHLFALDALLTIYPDAMIVQTHRDPVDLIPSVCSLCWSSRSPLGVGTDRQDFGRRTLDLWERAIRQMMEARVGRDPAQFFDLSFERFVADPLASIGEIHDYFGLGLSAEAESEMRRFRVENPKGQHGEHRPATSVWGFEPDEVAERFADYSQAYAVESATR